jgi:hypothetical protein
MPQRSDGSCPMNETRADAALVAAHLAGDRTALEGIYDLIATERLDQLRDQRRLKPWLFAILRNQVFTRSKRRVRTRATDFSAAEAPEVAAPIDPMAEGGSAAYAELAELMRGAAVGLEERDQLVMEYTLRQDLTGADLADALGVSLEQSYVRAADDGRSARAGRADLATRAGPRACRTPRTGRIRDRFRVGVHRCRGLSITGEPPAHSRRKNPWRCSSPSTGPQLRRERSADRSVSPALRPVAARSSSARSSNALHR